MAGELDSCLIRSGHMFETKFLKIVPADATVFAHLSSVNYTCLLFASMTSEVFNGSGESKHAALNRVSSS